MFGKKAEEPPRDKQGRPASQSPRGRRRLGKEGPGTGSELSDWEKRVQRASRNRKADAKRRPKKEKE